MGLEPLGSGVSSSRSIASPMIGEHPVIVRLDYLVKKTTQVEGAGTKTYVEYDFESVERKYNLR
jgi:hypothetical protein